MSDLDHDAISELLGPYALDAVEGDERRLVEDHVAKCVRCADELDGFRGVAARIANSGGHAPVHLWESIAAQIDHPAEGTEPPPIRHILVRDTQPRRLSQRRWRVGQPLVAGAVAAGLVVIAALGVQVGRLDHRVTQLQAASAQQAVAHAAALALSDNQAQHVVLEAAHSSGPATAQIAILPSGTGFLVNRRLPRVASDQTYQLWGQVGGALVSLGVLGSAPADVSFHVDPGARITAFAVTVEHAGGVVQSTHIPVAVSSTTT